MHSMPLVASSLKGCVRPGAGRANRSPFGRTQPLHTSQSVPGMLLRYQLRRDHRAHACLNQPVCCQVRGTWEVWLSSTMVGTGAVLVRLHSTQLIMMDGTHQFLGKAAGFCWYAAGACLSVAAKISCLTGIVRWYLPVFRIIWQTKFTGIALHC